MSTKTTRATAIHEAGHAVIGRHVGLGAPTKISIEDDADSFGRVEHRAPGEWFDPDAAMIDGRVRRFTEQHILTGFGGPLAEKRFTGRYSHKAAADDHRRIIKLASPLCRSQEETEAYIEWLRCRCSTLVANDVVWQEIESVAEALIENGVLSAHQFRLVVAAVSDRQVAQWRERVAVGGGE